MPCRRAGFIYQYYEAIEQDLEGSLEIVTTQMDTTVTTNVDNGLCQDFFELRMVRRYCINIPNSTTCLHCIYAYYIHLMLVVMSSIKNVVAMY